jgi:hypothetical protein
MSQPEFPREGTRGGPSDSSNTWIIIVVVVLAICGLCVCGGVGVVFWVVSSSSAPMEAAPRPGSEPSPTAPDWESPADESDSD